MVSGTPVCGVRSGSGGLTLGTAPQITDSHLRWKVSTPLGRGKRWGVGGGDRRRRRGGGGGGTVPPRVRGAVAPTAGSRRLGGNPRLGKTERKRRKPTRPCCTWGRPGPLRVQVEREGCGRTCVGRLPPAPWFTEPVAEATLELLIGPRGAAPRSVSPRGSGPASIPIWGDTPCSLRTTSPRTPPAHDHLETWSGTRGGS